MTKIVKYSIVVGRSDQTTLVDKINELIEDGWQPFGRPHVENNYVTQVMVMYARA